jgi:anti-sigma B factor antagonist
LFCITDNLIAGSADHGLDVAVVSASGELDYASSPRFRECLLGHSNTPGRHLVVDLSEVTFIDSTAIGVLIAAVTRLQESGASLAVACAEENERVLRIFDIAGVASMIALYRSRTDALLALASVRPSDVALWVKQTTRSAASSERETTPRLVVARRYARETASLAQQLEAAASAEVGHSVDELA